MFCKYAIPHMPPRSAIVNTSSVHAHETEAGVAPYAASKGGMEAFVRVLALELEEQKDPRQLRRARRGQYADALEQSQRQKR